MKRLSLRLVSILLMVLVPQAAFAHTGIGTTAAFDAGIAHPFSGIDHMLAMVAVGLWAGLRAFSSEVNTGSREENASRQHLRGEKALWLWPACFVGAMVIGGVLGIEGIPIPFVEQGIIASIVLLGLAVALALSAPLAVGAVLIARRRHPAWPCPWCGNSRRRQWPALRAGFRAGDQPAARHRRRGDGHRHALRQAGHHPHRRRADGRSRPHARFCGRLT